MPSTTKIRPASSMQGSELHWHKLYFDAVLENDPQRALAKMQRARGVLEVRIVQLQKGGGGYPNELSDLKSAMTYLRMLVSLSEDGAATPWAATA